MERGLREVLPKSTKETRIRFAQHIVPIIAELCTLDMTPEEKGSFIDELLVKISDLRGRKTDA
jgi:hypothetical protein